jgi:CRISPR-associated RAMP protein (TIGR02581 family)
MLLSLERKYLFTGVLQLKTALHIGGGRATLSPSDNPVIRTAGNNPFIPGSSFKGAFRSTVEKLIGLLSGVWSCCLIEGESDCPTAKQREFSQRREKEDWSESKLKAILDDELCHTCKLFGSPFSASRIFFGDLYLSKGSAGITRIRDGVAIDRDSEKAMDRLKYDYEVVDAAARFDLRLTLENPSDTDLCLTCLGINEFASDMGGYMGGLRSRGMGHCQIPLEDLKIYGVELSKNGSGDALKKYLIGRTLEDKLSLVAQGKEAGKFLDEQIRQLLLHKP